MTTRPSHRGGHGLPASSPVHRKNVARNGHFDNLVVRTARPMRSIVAARRSDKVNPTCGELLEADTTAPTMGKVAGSMPAIVAGLHRGERNGS
jgi:hypothetical protein